MVSVQVLADIVLVLIGTDLAVFLLVPGGGISPSVFVHITTWVSKVISQKL